MPWSTSRGSEVEAATRRAAPRTLARLCPRAGVRVQIVSAAVMWAIGAAILLGRGTVYASGHGRPAWVLTALLAAAIAIPKSRYLLDRAAARAVARIRARGPACWLGFLSWRSWLLVGTMMGAGITLRRLVITPGAVSAGIMGALYLGVGGALAIADRVFWLAALRRQLPHDLDAAAAPPDATP